MSLRAWIIAARPPTLLAAVAPVLVGGGLAVHDGVFRWDAGMVTVAAAVLINAAANFANDASDARRGADTADRIGPPRAVATGLLTARQVWRGTAITVAAAAGLGLYLAWISSWVIVAIGVAAILAMLTYTGGPWPYGYKGFGELFVFAFFGVAAVVGSRYVHDSSAPPQAWWLAVPVGFLVTAILVVNNVRDIETDRAVGKRTLAVILGRAWTRRLYVGLVGGAFILVPVLAALDTLPRGTLMIVAALPFAVRPTTAVLHSTDGPTLVAALRQTARLHLVFGALLAVGLQI